MAFIDIFAIIVLVVVIASAVALFVILGMTPGAIARRRSHPWAEAVSVAGWVTLLCGFVLWPIALIWAYVDVPARPERKQEAAQ
ncbi:DUF3302 domain-containing protein [Xanthobacter versatilis]|uniref:DUF3302 domain-containing protein n=1 Tax=Xanthobacter autotrophicus (strain ATCC BAA-1158 / Py2) TaxID=78245 RepID=A7IKV1_XANP2|nr:conserved hypothetical protein [Xanthobacter autotrophicus Py2]